jgi:hypothetical protein
VFGNFVSFHFSARPAETDAATVAALRRDMAEAVRTNFVKLWAGMNFIRYYPPRHLLRLLAARDRVVPLRRHGRGTPALLAPWAWKCARVPCAGCASASGLAVFFTRVGDLESIVAVWVDGVVTADEVERLLDDVGAALPRRRRHDDARRRATCSWSAGLGRRGGGAGRRAHRRSDAARRAPVRPSAAWRRPRWSERCAAAATGPGGCPGG